MNAAQFAEPALAHSGSRGDRFEVGVPAYQNRIVCSACKRNKFVTGVSGNRIFLKNHFVAGGYEDVGNRTWNAIIQKEPHHPPQMKSYAAIFELL
jgi:hypothetical protein